MLRRSSIVPLLVGCALAATTFADDGAESTPVALPKSTQFDLTSKSGEIYRIFVGEPINPPPAEGSPIVYLTDGNPNFPAMLSAVRRGEPASTGLVVAIGYPSDDPKEHSRRRYIDLTTEADPDWLAKQPPNMRPEGTGGSEAFLRFLLDELRPEIEKRYAVDKKRQALFGHSLGGLFVLNAYFAEPEAFQIYGASSPSIWWNDRAVLKREEEFAKTRGEDMPSSKLLVSVGERERAGSGIPSERAALLTERRQSENASELVDRLSALKGDETTIRFEEFPQENHGSALLPACNRTAQALIATGRPTPPPSGPPAAPAQR